MPLNNAQVSIAVKSHAFKAKSSFRSRTNNKGFTLLEVLIAIGITAMIGLGSWQILNSAIKTNEHTQAKLEELKAIQKTMLILSRDMQQVVARSIRDEYGDYQPALQTKGGLYPLEFTRSGWRNPLGDPRSNIQRVAYELDEGKLVRHYWNVLDRSQDSESIRRTILTGVETFTLRFMKADYSWADEWPVSDALSEENTADPRQKTNQLPRAIKITFELEQYGKISRLYDLVSYLPNIAFKTEESSTGATDPGVTKP